MGVAPICHVCGPPALFTVKILTIIEINHSEKYCVPCSIPLPGQPALISLSYVLGACPNPYFH